MKIQVCLAQSVQGCLGKENVRQPTPGGVESTNERPLGEGGS